jgi:hypothetical protein
VQGWLKTTIVCDNDIFCRAAAMDDCQIASPLQVASEPAVGDIVIEAGTAAKPAQDGRSYFNPTKGRASTLDLAAGSAGCVLRMHICTSYEISLFCGQHLQDTGCSNRTTHRECFALHA